MGRPNALDNQQIEFAIKARKSGATLQAIADHLGVSKPTICREMKKHGIGKHKNEFDFSSVK